MSNAIIQTSFNSGEWSPSLNARVDLKQYLSGAALLRNFFVDYRGGATACPGTKYILQTKSTSTVRLIPFQASFSVNYILEFGPSYVRFFANGAPVLEAARNITGITQANPGVVTSNAHGFSNGDWVYIASVVGMTQVNGNYYIVAGATANTFQLTDLNGNNVNTTSFTAYSSGGTASRVYTLASPYAAADLASLKFAQDVNVMVLCHPNHAPYSLTYTSAANWALAAITFGSTVAAPTGQAVATTLAAGVWNYAYVITAVDANGQESAPSAFATLASVTDLRTNAGTNTITWSQVTGAASYNIYKAELRSTNPVPAGSMFGFVGNCTATTFIDSNISPDFSQSVPIVKNPFSGSGVQSVTVTAGGSYAGLAFPAVSFSGGGGSGAAGLATLQATAVSIVDGTEGISTVGTLLYLTQGLILRITAESGGTITAVSIVDPGNVVGGTVPSNPQPAQTNATFNITWSVTSVGITSPGTGYGTPPTVAFSTGAASATSTLGSPSSGNPTVPGFFQQRLVLAGPVSNPRQFNMSQPGTYYNFNVTDPIQPDNAFQGFLTSGTLNTIQSMISQPQGLAVLTDQGAWLINGGSPGSAVDAINTVANAQVFSGAAGPPPIVAGEDVLYVQSKGSIVRNMSYNWNKQVYGGTDISAVSSHLFYGYRTLEWAWAEEPFKVAWGVRNDGEMLCLTFLKEQELVAWTHRDTQGSFKSVASITETVTLGSVNAVYVVVQRTINGVTVQYIERLVEQYYPVGATDAWQVDCGLQYNGAATTTFTGAQHLAGMSVVGLGTDNTGAVHAISAFTMPVSGAFGISAVSPATGWTRMTIGLAYTPQLTTLGIDTGDPTIQGKMKKLPAVTVRVKDTKGLSIGTTFDNLVDMDDLQTGAIGKDTNALVTSTELVTGDALQALDPEWQVPGQYCIQQSLPYPATILGLIPQLVVGDTNK